MFRISCLARASPSAFYARSFSSGTGKWPQWKTYVKQLWIEFNWRKRWSCCKERLKQLDWQKRWSGFKHLLSGTAGAGLLYSVQFLYDKQKDDREYTKEYDLVKAGMTKEKAKVDVDKNLLATRAHDKAWIARELDAALRPKIGSIDRVEEITLLQKLDVPKLMVVEGMKGVGKSCTMLQLCLQQIVKKEEPALFLTFKKNSITEVEKILMNDEIAFLDFVKQCDKKPLTVVVEDFNHFLLEEKNGEKREDLVTLFWTAVQSGAKVVFTCSDYGLVGLMKAYPSLHSIRCYQHRFKAPDNAALTKWINDALAARQLNTIEGNSSTDVAHYCDGVGTLRDFANGLQEGRTVRQISESVFEREIQAFHEHLTALLYSPEQKANAKLDKEVQALLHLGSVSTEERALLATTLETLFEQQFVLAGNDDKVSLCRKLVRHNIIRPIDSTQETSFYEFHSFAAEVAIRALLKKPLVTPKLSPKTESKGRGTQELINYLSERDASFFNKKRQAVDDLLLQLPKPDSPQDPQSPK